MAAQIAPSTIADVLLRYVNATHSSCRKNKHAFSRLVSKQNQCQGTVIRFLLSQIKIQTLMQCTIIFYTKYKILAKLSGCLQPQKENAEAGPSTERLQQLIFLLS